MSNTNTEKLQIFLEVARALNRQGIIPVLYGSLGLYRVIDRLERQVNDIDILVSDQFLGAQWTQLLKIVTGLSFVLKDEHEHEFLRNGEIVAFGKVGDLDRLAKITIEELQITNEADARFRELSPEQYLNCYKFMLRDRYRQEKRGTADREKIALIERYFQERNS